MEALGSSPAGVGHQRRSRRLAKKQLVDRVVVIDLEDEREEVEFLGSSSTRPGAIAGREDEGEEPGRGTKSEVDEKEGLGAGLNPTSSWRSFETDIAKRVKEMSLEDIEDASQGFRHLGNDDDKEDLFAASVANQRSVWQEADFVDLSSSSSESGEDGDGDMGVSVEEQEEEIVTSDDAALLAEVMKVIKEGGDLKKLKVESLKAYLRHHKLRMVGLKAVLLSRIQEHLRIKDGQGEEVYPRSSFRFDCTGDVCLGDTVLFLQNVYDTPFDIQKRCASGPPLGQRWIAGKVVNESYGAEKQQHTFTIEVLWSRGTRPFHAMCPVKIKGRNLYRMRTRRQPWPNEAERQKVLDEKHARGAKARAIRRAAKSLKLRGRTKSRQDARVHPYLRSQTTEPPRIRPPMSSQNSVPYARIHTQDDVHRGSFPALPAPARSAPSIHPHRTHTQRACVTERYPAPGPTVARERYFHGQQRHHESLPATFPAPEPAVPARGRNFLSEKSRYDGSAQAHRDVPSAHFCQWNQNRAVNEDSDGLRFHVHESMQHGRVRTHRQVNHSSLASQNTAHPNYGRQQGAVTVPCSNAGCDKLGAKQCISRSCASCCSKNGTTRGRCPRHR